MNIARNWSLHPRRFSYVSLVGAIVALCSAVAALGDGKADKWLPGKLSWAGATYAGVDTQARTVIGVFLITCLLASVIDPANGLLAATCVLCVQRLWQNLFLTEQPSLFVIILYGGWIVLAIRDTNRISALIKAGRLAMNRLRHAWNLLLLGRWSPLARLPDVLTIAVILNLYTAYAFRDPVKYISKASIYGTLTDKEQIAASIGSLLVCLIAYVWPFPGGWAALIFGIGLRAYDALAQGSPIGTLIYGIIFVMGCIRMIQQQREADLTRVVMREARVVIREREAVDALLRQWDDRQRP